MNAPEIPLHKKVGFDYSGALLELRSHFSYEQLAKTLGYKSKGGISKVLAGSPPAHVKGEAIWALYCDTFGKKPPLKVHPSGRTTNKT